MLLRHLKAAPVTGKSASDAGWIEGYAAVWNYVDSDKEIFVRGAFLDSLKTVVPERSAKLMIKHYRDGADTTELIGTITDAREDDYGLWIHAELSTTQQAQDIRQLILEGHIKTLSVGFYVLDFDVREVALEDGEKLQVKAITKAFLLETTVTIRPANPRAAITGAKAVSPSFAAQFAAQIEADKAYLRRIQLEEDIETIKDIERLIDRA